MTAMATQSTSEGYLLGKDEGEAHWLLGMLEIVKISGADTNGEYGLLEVTVRKGDTETDLTSSADDPTAVLPGDSVTFTAVVWSDDGVPKPETLARLGLTEYARA